MKKKIIIVLFLMFIFITNVKAGILYLPGQKIEYDGEAYPYDGVFTCLYDVRKTSGHNIGIVIQSNNSGITSIDMLPIEYYPGVFVKDQQNIKNEIAAESDLDYFCKGVKEDEWLSPKQTFCYMRHSYGIYDKAVDIIYEIYQGNSDFSIDKNFYSTDFLTDNFSKYYVPYGTSDDNWVWDFNENASNKQVLFSSEDFKYIKTDGKTKNSICPTYLVYEWDKQSNGYILYLTNSSDNTKKENSYYFKNHGADVEEQQELVKKYTDSERALINCLDSGKCKLVNENNEYDNSHKIETPEKSLDGKKCYYTYMDNQTGINGCVELTFSTVNNTDTEYNMLYGLDYNSILNFGNGYNVSVFGGKKVSEYLSNGNCLNYLYYQEAGTGIVQIATNYSVLKGVYNNSDFGTFTNVETFEQCNALNGTRQCTNYYLQIDELKRYKLEYYSCQSDICRTTALTKINKTKEKVKDLCRNYISTYDYCHICVEECLENLQSDIDIFGDTNDNNNECMFSQKTTSFIKNIIRWIKYFVPVLIIILSILDFVKAVVGKEEEMKKAQGKFIKRLIIGALIFLAPIIIGFIIEKLGFVSEGCNIFTL